MVEFVFFAAIAVGFANAISFDSNGLSNRIVNGVLSAENQFPYAVSLQLRQPVGQATGTRGHRCGGVLITLQHVLTTASCLFDTNPNGSQVQITPADYRIFGGSVSLNNDTVADRVRDLANFTIHPEYIAPPAHLNDIAIITLTMPFLATTVTPLALPSPDYDPADFTLCTVAGWGATVAGDQAPPSIELRFANKYTYNHHLCTVLFNNMPTYPNIMPTMTCAASYDIISSGCRGDNGNALVCNNTLTGLLFMHSECSSSSFPELYTTVNNYTTWIRTISAASSFTPGIFLLSLISILQLLRK